MIKLKKIDLSKSKNKPGGSMTTGRTIHPDIKLKKQYLVKVDGRYTAGTFSMQWYGLNFNGFYDVGLQYDMPGTNHSKWEGIWEIID